MQNFNLEVLKSLGSSTLVFTVACSLGINFGNASFPFFALKIISSMLNKAEKNKEFINLFWKSPLLDSLLRLTIRNGSVERLTVKGGGQVAHK